MSPLERRSGGSVTHYEDNEELSRYRWAKIFGVYSYTVSYAIIRGEARVGKSVPRHPRQPAPFLTPVEDFPNIIRGFQRTELRPDGYHYHQWSLGVDTQADEFSVTPPSGEVLVYKRPK